MGVTLRIVTSRIQKEMYRIPVNSKTLCVCNDRMDYLTRSLSDAACTFYVIHAHGDLCTKH